MVFNELTLLLHILLLALIYVFLFMVIKVVSRDLLSAIETEATEEEKMPRITVLKGAGFNESIDFIITDQIVIGRAPDCDIILDDNFTSSHHARIYSADSAYWLEDLKSTNGTTIGNRRIEKPVKLKKGSKFKIGKNVFQFNE